MKKTSFLLPIIVFSIFSVFYSCNILSSGSEEVIIKFDAKTNITIYDSQGLPIPNTNLGFVFIIDGKPNYATRRDEITDAEGKFTFKFYWENLESRYHREKPIVYGELEKFYMGEIKLLLLVTKSGFEGKEIEIALKDGDDKTITVVLEKKK